MLSIYLSEEQEQIKSDYGLSNNEPMYVKVREGQLCNVVCCGISLGEASFVRGADTDYAYPIYEVKKFIQHTKKNDRFTLRFCYTSQYDIAQAYDMKSKRILVDFGSGGCL